MKIICRDSEGETVIGHAGLTQERGEELLLFIELGCPSDGSFVLELVPDDYILKTAFYPHTS